MERSSAPVPGRTTTRTGNSAMTLATTSATPTSARTARPSEKQSVQRILFLLSVLVAASLAVSGCSSSPTPSPSEPSLGPASESPSSPSPSDLPAPVQREELVNQSLGFPFLGNGNNERVEFGLGTHSSYLLTFQAFANCGESPMVSANEARLVLTAPNGTRTDFSLASTLGGGQAFHPCMGSEPLGEMAYSPQEQLGQAVPGGWVVETVGEFSGRVEVQVVGSP